MKIERDTTVNVEYTLKNKDGEILDSSQAMGPLEYIHGYGLIIQGLERALEGKEEGESFKKEVPPSEAYGDVIEDLVMETNRSQFPEGLELKPGMEFEAGNGQQTRVAVIKKIEGDKITVDMNHPLAGETLYFDVKVLSVKKTSEEELQAMVQSMSSGCGCGCGDTESSCGCGGCSGCH